MALKAPFPYFGGKSTVADVVWRHFGSPKTYVEPFCGSAAVLLARPGRGNFGREIVNDYDGNIANFWRAVKYDPAGVAEFCELSRFTLKYWRVFFSQDDTRGVCKNDKAGIERGA